jgi:hypothetical protein
LSTSLPHFVVNVVPRTEGDNINLQWQPKQLNEEEMSTIELKIKEVTGNTGVSTQAETDVQKQQQQKKDVVADEDNHLWKSVNRRVAR